MGDDGVLAGFERLQVAVDVADDRGPHAQLRSRGDSGRRRDRIVPDATGNPSFSPDLNRSAGEPDPVLTGLGCR